MKSLNTKNPPEVVVEDEPQEGGAPTDPILPPDEEAELPDADGDGLDDAMERSLGTNPSVADTDGDGLSDSDEVQIYNTDPINPDTDGDSYLDGQEVIGGYNPNGEGRLFNVPGL